MTNIQLFALFMLGFVLGVGLMTAIFMWFTCKHEYEILDAYKKAIDYADTDEHIIKRIYVSRCKHCGKIKKTVI